MTFIECSDLQAMCRPGLLYDHKKIEVPTEFSAPFRVNYETNDICNMGCGFCFADYKEGVEAHKALGLESRGVLETHEVTALIEQTAQIGSKQFLLGGGDPFIRKDTPDLIKHAHEEGLQVAVDTNAVIGRFHLEVHH